MKIINKVIHIQSGKLYQFIALEDEIEKAIAEKGINSGFCLIRILHTTAALVVTERDPAVHSDFIRNLERMLPKRQSWDHSYEGEVNARAHQAAAWIGSAHWAPVREGRLVLGKWQGIFFVELFEPRQRSVEIVIVGDG